MNKVVQCMLVMEENRLEQNNLRVLKENFIE